MTQLHIAHELNSAEPRVTSPLGEKLMTITVGEQPDNGSPFAGTTDIAFGSNGHFYITDGYGNARVLEYTADGKRVKQWGKAGSSPGELHLPHVIQISEDGTIYVADREKSTFRCLISLRQKWKANHQDQDFRNTSFNSKVAFDPIANHSLINR
jgi:hypothetical protein